MRLSPESFSWESSLLSAAGTASAAAMAWRTDPTGVGEQGQGTRGVPGNLGDPFVSIVTAGWSTGSPTPG